MKWFWLLLLPGDCQLLGPGLLMCSTWGSCSMWGKNLVYEWSLVISLLLNFCGDHTQGKSELMPYSIQDKTDLFFALFLLCYLRPLNKKGGARKNLHQTVFWKLASNLQQPLIVNMDWLLHRSTCFQKFCMLMRSWLLIQRAFCMMLAWRWPERIMLMKGKKYEFEICSILSYGPYWCHQQKCTDLDHSEIWPCISLASFQTFQQWEAKWVQVGVVPKVQWQSDFA